jgi:hypothetical protein
MVSASNGDCQKLLEMVVHDNGIEEVGGSIPPGSTNVFKVFAKD